MMTSGALLFRLYGLLTGYETGGENNIVRGERLRHDACIPCAAKHCLTKTVAYR